ncbi:MAG TPA: CsgG/HfaB family protein [Gemmatimonadaceae bacterium]|nr:CsgG/HfaB family protein [Gemmatimonadaceae bacterium]
MLSIPVRSARWIALAVLAGAAPLQAQATPDQSRAPTVAVLYFTNSALVDHAQYAPLSKGIADMLVDALAQNPGIRVVERDQLQHVLEELKLHGTDQVDPETAVRVGKLLGARHMLTGGFVIDPRRDIRLVIRAVNVETSQVEYTESVQGKADNILALISELGTKVNTGLRLPPLTAVSQRRQSSTSAADQYRAFYLVSKSIEEQDKKNFDVAIGLLREAIQIYPEFDRAKVRLAVLERGTESQ